MVALYIVITALLALTTLMLFAPVDLIIDTETEFYGARLLWGLAVCSVNWHIPPSIRIKLAGFVWDVPLKPAKKPMGGGEREPARKQPKPKKPGRKLFRKALSALRTVRVREFVVAVNSGDPVLNAYIYPALLTAGQLLRRNIAVTFCGNTRVLVGLRVIPARVLAALLK